MTRRNRIALPYSLARRVLCRSLFVLVMAVGIASPAIAQVPGEFAGDWVPTAAACTSPARIRVEAARITLVNGADQEGFAGIEMAGPAYFGPDYRGVQAVAITQFESDQPVIMTFNASEKKGVAQAELASPTGGNVNAFGKALNARLAKLNLVKRFPLHQVALKKCAAAR